MMLMEANTVVDALTTGVTAIAGDATSAIGAVIPVALPIMGAVVVLGIGIKVFKIVTKK